MPTLKWEAVYQDGSVHTQEQLKNSENIDRNQLTEFRLFSGDKLVFVAFFKDKKRKLIFRRRVFMNMLSEVQDVVYLVGWHENVKGVSVKSICYIYGDGRVEFDDDRSDLELVPCEK